MAPGWRPGPALAGGGRCAAEQPLPQLRTSPRNRDTPRRPAPSASAGPGLCSAPRPAAPVAQGPPGRSVPAPLRWGRDSPAGHSKPELRAGCGEPHAKSRETPAAHPAPAQSAVPRAAAPRPPCSPRAHPPGASPEARQCGAKQGTPPLRGQLKERERDPKGLIQVLRTLAPFPFFPAFAPANVYTAGTGRRRIRR